MNWCLLAPILAGLFSFLLGYILGKSLSKDKNSKSNALKTRNAELKKDLKTCKAAGAKLQTDLARIKSTLSTTETLETEEYTYSFNTEDAPTSFDRNKAETTLGKSIKENDLTIIHDITTEIQELFLNHDIISWKGLSECTIEECYNVLHRGGDPFKSYNPKTWPEQARLAYAGKWERLMDLQEKLKVEV